MSERIGAASSVGSSSGGTERVQAVNLTGRESGSVVTEFLDAARSAAESLLEEQKRQIAGRVSGIAEALRCGADPLHESQSAVLARYLREAAAQVESVSRRMHERSWSELVADTEAFARRRPMLFVLGAVVTGFAVGRLLWASAGGHQQAARSSPSNEPTRTVTAAVSSGSGTSAGEFTGNAVPPAGAMEA